MKSKIYLIEFLRGISVISVILYHYFPKIFPLGYLGVDIFFVISGYVITNSLLLKKSSWAEFPYFGNWILPKIGL
jgi:peptidoglycan/LPS O-acetylase OafA/YrhL